MAKSVSSKNIFVFLKSEYKLTLTFVCRQVLLTPVWEQELYYALLAIGLVIVWVTAMLL